MSGHSKWSTIKRAKGAADAKRGKIFTKIAREIMVAAKAGGPSPEENAALRIAIGKARQANMPKDNVQRAIDRATATGGGEHWEEIRYEAYGPGGVALLIDTLTDNRNRTVSDLRSTLTKAGGSLGETGSVAWTFEQKGVVLVDLGNGCRCEEDRGVAGDRRRRGGHRSRQRRPGSRHRPRRRGGGAPRVGGQRRHHRLGRSHHAPHQHRRCGRIEGPADRAFD